ncbi:MAG: hypothetical protein U0V70_19400 [Terriglobia bacterium]
MFDDIHRVDSTVLETDLVKVNPEHRDDSKRKRKSQEKALHAPSSGENVNTEKNESGKSLEHPLLDIRI